MEYIVDRLYAERSYAAHAYRQSAQTTVYTAQHTVYSTASQTAKRSAVYVPTAAHASH